MELSAFFKNDYSSFIARQHPLMLLGEIFMLTMVVSQATFPLLCVITGIVLFLHMLAGSRFRDLAAGILSFWPLYIFIAAAPLFSAETLAGGLHEAALRVYRFSHLVLIGLLAAGSLSPRRAHHVSYMILRLIPFVNAKRGAAIVRIVFALIPQLFAVMQQMKDARAARAGASSRNRLRQAFSQGYSLAAYFLIYSTHYAEALESRLFTIERIPEGRYPVRAVEFALFLALLLFCTAALGWKWIIDSAVNFIL